MALATFGAGCFWHVEEAFRHVPGVLNATSGYTGGRTRNPSYEDVCSHTTGHAEVVRVEYDPERVSYEDLLRVFFDLHDPTTLNRQGPDIGDQYRSAIFYHTPDQKAQAEGYVKGLTESKAYNRPIVTQISPAPEFWPAEDYHQQYLAKRGLAACPTG
jgi:peptide-methionine (S)-S-oxide reductase